MTVAISVNAHNNYANNPKQKCDISKRKMTVYAELTAKINCHLQKFANASLQRHCC